MRLGVGVEKQTFHHIFNWAANDALLRSKAVPVLALDMQNRNLDSGAPEPVSITVQSERQKHEAVRRRRTG